MGLLSSMLTGGAAGGFQAYGQVKDEEIKAAREAEKEAALTARMENMARLQREYQTSENALGRIHTETLANSQREFQAGENALGRTFSSGETDKQISANKALDDNRTKREIARDELQSKQWGATHELAKKEHEYKMKELILQSGDKELSRKVDKVYAEWRVGNIKPEQLNAMPAEIQIGVESKQRAIQSASEKANLENKKTQAEIDETNAKAGQKGDLGRAKENANKSYQAVLKGGGTQEAADAAYDAVMEREAGGKKGTNKVDLTAFDQGNNSKTDVGKEQQPILKVPETPIEPMSIDQIKMSAQGNERGLVSDTQGILNTLGGKGTQVDSSSARIGEGNIELAIRKYGISSDLATEKQIANGLRAKYPNATEQQIIDIIIKASQGTK